MDFEHRIDLRQFIGSSQLLYNIRKLLNIECSFLSLEEEALLDKDLQYGSQIFVLTALSSVKITVQK